MARLYSAPLRVYLLLAAIALAGMLSGLKLPISLFPNSSRPRINVHLGYADSTPEEFLNNYGLSLENQLHSISTDNVEVEEIKVNYDASGVDYDLIFKWGVPSKAALREVEAVVNSFGARLPKDIRDSVNIWTRRDSGGFLALSFYSKTRSLDELYDLLEPILLPKLGRVPDASHPGLWNPSKKEIRLELNPEAMASLQLFPRDVERAVTSVLSGYNGGSVTVGTQQLRISMPRQVSGDLGDVNEALGELSRAPVVTPSGRLVHLADIAKIDLGPQTTGAESFKTSGAPSLILFAQPRPGGNVKRMSEDILDVVRGSAPSFPPDVEYRVLVDPSEFIRASISNVFHEVLIGAALAVAVLFLFIGSLRNTITAAIEIPLSMVLAFILMKLSGMNLNLISLGGLALSAGMNVDASVVVMENIFRHFETAPAGLDAKGRLRLVTHAVNEVRFSVIASTISSLVVFLPLAFTSDLSYAILGDLAKTVVFSHGFSAIVALVLVPTVRLHLMSRTKPGEAPAHVHSPIESWIRGLENAYARALGRFIESPAVKRATYASIAGLLGLLFVVALPRLPREIIGRPDTDWMVLGVNTRGNTLLRQMESLAEETESKMLAKHGDKILYTFNQIVGPNNAYLMARLKDKRDMTTVWKSLEAQFANTPLVQYFVAPWNPAELPIPDPPQLRVAVRGGELADRARTTQELSDLLQSNKAFPRLETTPDVERREAVYLTPNFEQWAQLMQPPISSRLLPSDVADLARVATESRRAGQVQLGSRLTDVILRFPEAQVATVEDLAALPVGVGSKIVPLKALAAVQTREARPAIYREDERELFLLTGRENEETKPKADEDRTKASKLLADWQARHTLPKGVSVSVEDAEKDLHDALSQLSVAVALSIALIFLTLVLQFGDVVNSLLVLVAVPLGLIGVLLSLVVFRSTLSLNSVLGVILLNGIAVANSIILVDFLKRLVDQGLPPREAAVEAARKRLRPILITSLTTVLGMLPIALGMGEGGRILQPLGIAVSGGLWFSMGLTLFVVPALQVAYLESRAHRARTIAAEVPAVTQPPAFIHQQLVASDGPVLTKEEIDEALWRLRNRPRPPIGPQASEHFPESPL